MEPNKFNTATIVLMVGTVFAMLDPFLRALGQYIQAHSLVVFSDEYMNILQKGVETLVTVWFTYRHTQTV